MDPAANREMRACIDYLEHVGYTRLTPGAELDLTHGIASLRRLIAMWPAPVPNTQQVDAGLRSQVDTALGLLRTAVSDAAPASEDSFDEITDVAPVKAALAALEQGLRPG